MSKLDGELDEKPYGECIVESKRAKLLLVYLGNISLFQSRTLARHLAETIGRHRDAGHAF